MKRISLLHTVRSVYQTFAEQLEEALPGEEIKISNTLDEFLAVDANEKGSFTEENHERLRHLLQAKEMEKADLIVVTCSTLTPAVEKLRPFIKTPLIAIDDAMAAKAVECGERILVMATAGSAMQPEKEKLRLEAEKAGKEVVLGELLCPEAFKAIQRQEKETHDELLRQAAKGISGFDTVVLAQASMAHLEAEIAQLSGCRVLSSPKLCMAQVKELLYSKG